MGERATAWQRLKGPGLYPVEYASWLLNPLRYLIVPPGRIVGRLQLLPTDRVLEIGCGPGFFSPAIARQLATGHLTLLDAQAPMLRMAARRLEERGLANVTRVLGLAESLPFANAVFDVVFMVTALGEVRDRATAVKDGRPRPAPRRTFLVDRSGWRSGSCEPPRIGRTRDRRWPRQSRGQLGLVGQNLQLPQAGGTKVTGVMA